MQADDYFDITYDWSQWLISDDFADAIFHHNDIKTPELQLTLDSPSFAISGIFLVSK